VFLWRGGAEENGKSSGRGVREETKKNTPPEHPRTKMWGGEPLKGFKMKGVGELIPLRHDSDQSENSWMSLKRGAKTAKLFQNQ